MSRRRIVVVCAVIAGWLVAVVGAFAALARYSAKPGVEYAPRSGAAAFIAAHRHPGRALLIMVVHPRCPCTKASFSEMGDLLARAYGRCDALVVRYVGPGWPSGPRQMDLGGEKVPVLDDPGGAIATELGAETSGHCIFVDERGQIRFYGGLTAARGHRGRTPGQDAILDDIAGAKTKLVVAPVYGCSIHGSSCPPGISQ